MAKLKKVFLGIATIGSIAVLVRIMTASPDITTHSQKAFMEGERPTICVEGIQYFSMSRRPTSAFVDFDGSAVPCTGGLPSWTEVGRYQRFCKNGAEVLRVRGHKTAHVFQRYDPSTRLPMTCTMP